MRLSYYTAIAIACITLTVHSAIQATKDYCDRNAEKAVTNAINSVNTALPTLVGTAINEYMSDKGIPTVTTNTIIEYHENTITNNYYTNTYTTNNIYTTETITNIVSETTYQTNITYNISSDIITDTFEYITPHVWFDAEYIGKGFYSPDSISYNLDNSWCGTDEISQSYWADTTNRWLSVNNITSKEVPDRPIYYASSLNNIYDDGEHVMTPSDIKLFGVQLLYSNTPPVVYVYSNLAFYASLNTAEKIIPSDTKDVTIEICLYIQPSDFRLEEKYIPMFQLINRYSKSTRFKTLSHIIYSSNDFASKYIDITNTNGISNIFSIHDEYVDMMEFQYPITDRTITYSICSKVIDDDVNVDAKLYANYRNRITVYNSYKKNILNNDFIIDTTNSLMQIGQSSGKIGICPRENSEVKIENDYVASSFPIFLYSLRIYTNILSNAQRDYNAVVDRNRFYRRR